MEACEELAALQDDLDWKDVSAKFKVTCRKWAKSLDQLRQQAQQTGASVPHSVAKAAVLMPAVGGPRDPLLLLLARAQADRSTSVRCGHSASSFTK